MFACSFDLNLPRSAPDIIVVHNLSSVLLTFSSSGLQHPHITSHPHGGLKNILPAGGTHDLVEKAMLQQDGTGLGSDEMDMFVTFNLRD